MADPIVASAADALEVLKDLFNRYGVGELAPLIVKYQTDKTFHNAKGEVDSARAIEDLRQSAQYKTRFAAKLARDEAIQKAREAGTFTTMTPIDEGQQLALEQEYTKKAREAGLPVGFYDNPQDFVTLITNDVNVSEYSSRISMAQQAALQSNAALREQLKQQYGIQEGDLTAFYLDADRARAVTADTTNQMVRKFNQAALQAAGISGTIAAQVADQSTPVQVNASQLVQEAKNLIGLTEETVGGEEALLTQQQAANVLIAGTQPEGSRVTDAEALAATQSAFKQRAARYQGGGQIAATAQGVVGLTQANI